MLRRTDLERTAKILGGLLIWRTSGESDAARSGVRQGDILLTANGLPTPDAASFMRARQLRDDGVELEVFRFGQRLRLEVKFTTRRSESDAERRLGPRASSARN
jgi:S1-C subfamily serine protease